MLQFLSEPHEKLNKRKKALNLDWFLIKIRKNQINDSIFLLKLRFISIISIVVFFLWMWQISRHHNNFFIDAWSNLQFLFLSRTSCGLETYRWRNSFSCQMDRIWPLRKYMGTHQAYDSFQRKNQRLVKLQNCSTQSCLKQKTSWISQFWLW